MSLLRLTLRQLGIFSAVARLGTTTAAGDEIGLSQSAVSSAINELERLLAMRLFDRAGRRLLLNDNGRSLLPRALALLDGALEIERSAQAGLAQQAPLLKIGASTTIGNYVLPELLARYLRESSGAPGAARQPQVVIGNTAEVCEAVAAFDLDVGLIEGPCHVPELNVAPWLHDEMLIVASASSAIAAAMQSAGDRNVPMRLLREQVWLLREHGSGTREATDQALLPQLLSYARSIELGSSEAIKHAAAAGLGVACLSAWVVQDLLAAGRLVVVRTKMPGLTRQCHIVVHRKKYPTAALRSFVALVAALPSSEALR